MSCNPCRNNYDWPAHAHAVGCPVRANLDVAQERAAAAWRLAQQFNAAACVAEGAISILVQGAHVTVKLVHEHARGRLQTMYADMRRAGYATRWTSGRSGFVARKKGR